MSKLPDKCSNCGSTKSKTFWDYKDGSILCDKCEKKISKYYEFRSNVLAHFNVFGKIKGIFSKWYLAFVIAFVLYSFSLQLASLNPSNLFKLIIQTPVLGIVILFIWAVLFKVFRINEKILSKTNIFQAVIWSFVLISVSISFQQGNLAMLILGTIFYGIIFLILIAIKRRFFNKKNNKK
ncbi:Uncharacterised protein [uncultured archaeon]|nr:Uncharacterised protein [uncultured archaeon]